MNELNKPALPRRKIIVVDDDVSIHLPLRYYLNEAGHTVMTVEDGQQAFKAIQKGHQEDRPFNLLITDIEMPELSGLELIDKLSEHNIELPVLVITGFGTKEAKRELLKRDCSFILDKPVQEKELLSSVASIFRANR